MITIRHYKWGKHIRVDGSNPTNDEVAYAVGLLDPHFPPPAIKEKEPDDTHNSMLGMG